MASASHHQPILTCCGNFRSLFSLSLSPTLFVSFVFVSVYLFDGIKCRPKWQKISMESVLEQQT